MMRRLWLTLPLLLTGCLAGGQLSQLGPAPLPALDDQPTAAQHELDQQTFLLGTVFDLRAARFVVSLELKTQSPTTTLSPSGQPAPDANRDRYIERRVFRLEVPALALYDLQHNALFDLPARMPHRHSVDLWLRAGTPSLDLEQGWFVGGALGWYKAGAVAVALTADFWQEQADVQGFNPQGALTNFQGPIDGWVFGLEVTIGAGEYALEAIQWLLDLDDKILQRRR
jgi:hypothetical protein